MGHAHNVRLCYVDVQGNRSLGWVGDRDVRGCETTSGGASILKSNAHFWVAVGAGGWTKVDHPGDNDRLLELTPGRYVCRTERLRKSDFPDLGLTSVDARGDLQDCSLQRDSEVAPRGTFEVYRLDSLTQEGRGPVGPKSDELSHDASLAFGFGVVFVIVLLLIAFVVKDPTPTQWFVFRVILAIAAAGVGAAIPGLISVSIQSYIRAGGAIALFVLIYSINPPTLVGGKRSRKPTSV